MSNPPVFIRDMSAEQAEIGAHNAFAAAGMYAATTFIAIFMYMHRSKQERISKLGTKSPRNGASAAAEASSLGADGTDPFSVPLVSNTTGATSASAVDTSASATRATSSGKKKKTKNTNNATVTSI